MGLGKKASAAAAAALLALTVAEAGAQTSGAGIVDEALKGVRQDQQRDSERVRKMIDEAVRGAESAPSGEETVSPPAPETLRPVGAETAPGVLPVGFRTEDLVGRTVDDGTGARLGTIRGVAVEDGGEAARAVIEFAPLFGRAAKTAAVLLDTLTPSTTSEGSYVLSLTTVGYDELPAYAWRDGAWRREG